MKSQIGIKKGEIYESPTITVIDIVIEQNILADASGFDVPGGTPPTLPGEYW